MRQMIVVVMAMVGLVGFAMPSEKEFAAARTVVADVMEPELQAMKDGKKKPGEVADFALSLMAESETAAAKYLLAGRAYALYVKGGDYEKAVKAMDELQNAIPDMPCDRILKDLTPVSKGVTEKKAPELYARLAQLKGRVHSQSEITKLKVELAKAKASEKYGIYRKLGENYAVMNDWKNALEYFVKAGGKVSEVAQSELDGAPADAKIAGLWWDKSEEKGIAKSVASAYRAHAAELYRKGLDEGTISGLNKRVAEQRIEAGAVANESTTVKSPFKLGVMPGTVSTISLSDNCKMDFVYCPAGYFKMGYEGAEKVAPVRQVQISRPFWMSKCRVTCRQLRNVGVNSEDSDRIADVRSPEQTIDVMAAVLTSKFGNLLPKGYVFRVCTEAEYEYVSKAKAKSGDPCLDWGYSKNGVNSPWGVEDMFRYDGETKLCFADSVPEDDGKLWVRRERSTLLTTMDYSKQPRRDPIMLGKVSKPIHLRRQFGTKMAKEKWKLSAMPRGKDEGSLFGSEFYFVAAPSVDMLNKFP